MFVSLCIPFEICGYVFVRRGPLAAQLITYLVSFSQREILSGRTWLGGRVSGFKSAH